jgi:hypothetical protein
MVVSVVWYDINCKFAGYFFRWAAKHPILAELLLGFPTIKFPLPCFHRYSHK